MDCNKDRAMDCNEDRALRRKEIAEKKFAEKDYIEAKSWAQVAKDLYPGLEFISLFITIIDIYLSREKIVNGQPDWYGVLGLENPATLDKISRNYYNLYLDIKIGKDNNVVGAGGALEIISEAFSNLTGAFWTLCPKCKFHFQYSNDKINKEIVCFYCCESFLAVPFSGTCPKKEKLKVVLGLRAPTATPVGKNGSSKRPKKDDGEFSVSGYQGDADA